LFLTLFKGILFLNDKPKKHSIEGFSMARFQNIIFTAKHGSFKLLNQLPQHEEGLPILFIHGFGSNPDIWFKYSESLGNYFYQKSYDIWALGLSDPIGGNIEQLAHIDLFESLKYIYEKRNKPIRIVAHSMGGIITRYAVTPLITHPYDLSNIEKLIEGITLLGVPNHGVTTPKFLNRVVESLELDIDIKVPSNIKLAFLQLLDSSDIITSLNKKENSLNPKIRWQNAFGTYDEVVPISSAKFELEELPKGIEFEQKEFPCDHMVYPLTKREEFSKNLKELLSFINIKIYPAIHTYLPVAEWIADHLITKK
jgi:hypothetical protein